MDGIVPFLKLDRQNVQCVSNKMLLSFILTKDYKIKILMKYNKP